jgi:autotransporter strand-loop-strand O-heptosyltransferase
MKVINVNPGLLPIPPNGWGAIEKIIWDYHQEMINLGIRSEIKYTDEVKYDDSVVVHVHVANLANMLHERNIPYIFTIHDHHAYLYGKDSPVFKENLKAIENSVISLSPCKYLIPYFGSKKLRYFSHAVNTNLFVNHSKSRNGLLCVANNGYAYDQSKDRKGFKIAIQAAMSLNMPITIAGPKNNQNFFGTLEPELNNYEKLTKLFDLDECSLIELYNKHDVFIHLSELEAGHPNLTLLEAMACGLPIVGTFEEDKYKGMRVVKRDFSEVVEGIKEVYLNYKEYQENALKCAQKNSYSNRVHDLAAIYSEYREKIFGDRLIAHYSDAKIKHVEAKNTIHISYTNGPKVEILGPVSKKYKVKFIDTNNGHTVYEGDIGNNMWTMASIKYFVKWKTELYEVVGENWTTLIESQELNLKDKKVKIVLDTQSLGDLMAYIGSVDEFQKKHECDLTCVVFQEELMQLFSKSYENIKFIKQNGSNDDFYATYIIGYFDQNNWQGNAPSDPKKISLTFVAQGILGLPPIEIKPKLKFSSNLKKPNSKYVCIGTHSTAQSKYWNNPEGWNKVVKYIKSKGYEVWDIDRYNSFGNGVNMNYIPNGVVDKTGDFSLEQRMAQLEHAEFFIGLGSGLSWLAWAVGKPVVLISGFSMEFAEFNTPYRVINKNVCHGCWNDPSCTFDKGDWRWCPRKKDFECTKQIYAEDVIKMIDKII